MMAKCAFFFIDLLINPYFMYVPQVNGQFWKLKHNCIGTEPKPKLTCHQFDVINKMIEHTTQTPHTHTPYKHTKR